MEQLGTESFTVKDLRVIFYHIRINTTFFGLVSSLFLFHCYWPVKFDPFTQISMEPEHGLSKLDVKPKVGCREQWATDAFRSEAVSHDGHHVDVFLEFRMTWWIWFFLLSSCVTTGGIVVWTLLVVFAWAFLWTLHDVQWGLNPRLSVLLQF